MTWAQDVTRAGFVQATNVLVNSDDLAQIAESLWRIWNGALYRAAGFSTWDTFTAKFCGRFTPAYMTKLVRAHEAISILHKEGIMGPKCMVVRIALGELPENRILETWKIVRARIDRVRGSFDELVAAQLNIISEHMPKNDPVVTKVEKIHVDGSALTREASNLSNRCATVVHMLDDTIRAGVYQQLQTLNQTIERAASRKNLTNEMELVRSRLAILEKQLEELK